MKHLLLLLMTLNTLGCAAQQGIEFHGMTENTQDSRQMENQSCQAVNITQPTQPIAPNEQNNIVQTQERASGTKILLYYLASYFNTRSCYWRGEPCTININKT